MFISFEGIEASGKSTLLASLDRALRMDGRRTLCTREPGGTAAGDAIRELFLHGASGMNALTELMLVNASRAQLVSEVIRPALAAGQLVLCDRYVHSTIAYQGYGRGIPLQIVESVCAAATGGLMPDLTILVDISYATSRARRTLRGKLDDRLEREDGDFHQRVREGYLVLGRHDPRVIIIDGEREPDLVLESAMAALSMLP